LSSSNKCEYFGRKNLITNEITYDYADYCRTDENKCGEKGKYFEKNNTVEFKIILHKFINISPYLLLIVFTLFLSYIKISYKN
jgi:hypothetical protein